MLNDTKKGKKGFYRAVSESKELGVRGGFTRIPEQDLVCSSEPSGLPVGRGLCLVYSTLQLSSERSRTGLGHIRIESETIQV